MNVVVPDSIPLPSPAVRGDARCDLNDLIGSPEEYEYVKTMLESRRLEQYKNRRALTRTATTNINPQTPPNLGMSKEVSSSDIARLIKRVPFSPPSDNAGVNNTQSDKDTTGSDESRRAEGIAEQGAVGYQQNESRAFRNDYRTMEYSQGASMPSSDACPIIGEKRERYHPHQEK